MVISFINKTSIYRSGIAHFLKSELSNDTVIFESESIYAFKRKGTGAQSDVIILAVELISDMLILQSIYEIKKNYPNARLVIIGEKADPDFILEYLSTGASAYLDNEATLEELIKCIKDVKEGKKFVNEDVFWKLLKVNHTKAPKPRQNGPSLTGREQIIAKYLSDGKKVTWIARELNLKPSTISTFKAAIFKKLLVNDVIKLRDIINDPAPLHNGQSSLPA